MEAHIGPLECDQFWRNLAILAKVLIFLAAIEGLFSIRHGLKSTLATFNAIWQIFNAANGQILKK